LNTAEKLVVGSAAAILVFKMLDDAIASKYQDLFSRYSEKFNVDAALLKAIARKESAFNPNATHTNLNGTRDYGIMQVNEKTFQHYGVNDGYLVPSTNIRIAANLLADIRNELGAKFSIFSWIASYNLGSPKVLKDGITNPGYVGEVYLYYTLYKLA
jgi:soluble lytic murein transglycosylase-like protein